MLEGKTLKILRSTLDVRPWALAAATAGQLFSDGKNYLQFSTAEGFVAVQELQMEGKRRMSVKDFLNGFKINQLI